MLKTCGFILRIWQLHSVFSMNTRSSNLFEHLNYLLHILLNRTVLCYAFHESRQFSFGIFHEILHIQGEGAEINPIIRNEIVFFSSYWRDPTSKFGVTTVCKLLDPKPTTSKFFFTLAWKKIFFTCPENMWNELCIGITRQRDLKLETNLGYEGYEAGSFDKKWRW
jgi:hypothetical protein